MSLCHTVYVIVLTLYMSLCHTVYVIVLTHRAAYSYPVTMEELAVVQHYVTKRPTLLVAAEKMSKMIFLSCSFEHSQCVYVLCVYHVL